MSVQNYIKYNCSGLRVFNSALDFGKLWTLIANISGTVNFGPLTRNMTLTFDLLP